MKGADSVSYPTYMPVMQPMAQPQVFQQPGIRSQPMMQQSQPIMRPMYGAPTPQPVKVNGRAGADAFYMGPNETAVLFDENEDIFFLKTTDGAGYPTVRNFRYEPVPEQGTAPAELPVSREEFEQLRNELNELKGALTNAKQPVRAAKGAKTAAAGGEAEE